MASGRRRYRKRGGRPFARQISKGYSFLSVVNTISHILNGDISGLLRHMFRKRAHKKLGGWLR